MKMSELVRRHLPLLRRLLRMNNNAKRKFIKQCHGDIVICLSECAKNVLKGNVPLKRHHLQKLRRVKKNVKQLALKKTPLKQKRKILQKGGFLGALLTPVLSVLGSLIGGVLTGQ